MRMFWMVCCVLSLCCVSSIVRADVVNPEPTNCPKGSIPSTSHAGPYCRPSTCTATTECKGGESCEELAVCVKEMTGQSNGGPFTLKNVVGLCNNGTCSEGTCETAKRCVSKLGCAGCDSGAGTRGDGTWAWLLGLVLLGVMLTVHRRAAVAVRVKKREDR